ncbi:MAG: cytochrome c biogenesis protein CcdA [bacterium]|nr:cytochrome c biogenesis protein CcdA [bacterium]
MTSSLIVPAFIAGVLMFLAPCTLPLVPAFLGFISGAVGDSSTRPSPKELRKKMMVNSLLYTLGFSVVFIALGTAFSWGGTALVRNRAMLSQIGGVFIILFGLLMMGILRGRFFQKFQQEKRINLRMLKPGNPMSAFLFGVSFAFGWTPCIGPVLGSVLFLASAQTTVLWGAVLLAVFSLGLAIPFLLVAVSFGHAAATIRVLTPALKCISFIGGIFLIGLGILLLTDQFSWWTANVLRLFRFIQYDALLNYF